MSKWSSAFGTKKNIHEVSRYFFVVVVAAAAAHKKTKITTPSHLCLRAPSAASAAACDERETPLSFSLSLS